VLCRPEGHPRVKIGPVTRRGAVWRQGLVKEVAVGPAHWSGAAGPPAVHGGRDAVVSRPGLFERLGAAGRVTEVSAPAGSGKTFLLGSWTIEAGRASESLADPGRGQNPVARFGYMRTHPVDGPSRRAFDHRLTLGLIANSSG
jgi:hypothetical protein